MGYPVITPKTIKWCYVLQKPIFGHTWSLLTKVVTMRPKYFWSRIKHRKIIILNFQAFLENIKKGIIFNNKNSYKDFIPVNKFCEIVEKLIIFNTYGIYNVSLVKKVFLRTIVSWLNLYNKKNVTYINSSKKHQSDNFTLNNDKLMKAIKIKNTPQDLKKYCIKLSKELFKI